MTHPRMCEEDDPGLRELRELCLSFPGSSEVESHGRPTFRTKKIFAVYGGGEKGSPGDGYNHPHSVLVKADDDEIRLRLRDPRFFVPAYYGPFGWIGLDFSVAPVDWDEVRELLEDSYRSTAPRSLVAKLDAEAG